MVYILSCFIQGDVDCMLGVLRYVTNSRCLRGFLKIPVTFDLKGSSDLLSVVGQPGAIITYFIRIETASGGNIVFDSHTDSW